MIVSDMQYRKFGRLDWKVAALGFGLERLPSDKAASVKMLRYAIDRGVNYLDVGWPFIIENNEDLSHVLGEALKNGYRQKIKLSATIPSANINTPNDFDRSLEKLLKWLDTDSINFLLLGGLNRYSWLKLQELDVLRWIEKTLANKSIGHIGFYFHDQYQFLREIVEACDSWAVAQFQYSLMDIDHHPGVSGLKYAADNGLGVVVSKPLLGGRLTSKIPESVSSIWLNAQPERSPAAWGLRWVWNHPEVATVVCDMSTLEQVKENIALADVAVADSFTVPEELVISRARDAYRALKPIPCTACRGCMPCGQDIDVPRIFEIYNDAVMYDDIETAKSIFRLESHNIDDCNECGTCMQACGKKIPITDWLKKARAMLDKGE